MPCIRVQAVRPSSRVAGSRDAPPAVPHAISWRSRTVSVSRGACSGRAELGDRRQEHAHALLCRGDDAPGVERARPVGRAEDEPVAMRAGQCPVAVGVERGAQATLRRPTARAPRSLGQRAGEVLVALGDQRGEQRVARGEVAVHGGARHAHRLRDPVEREGGGPALGDLRVAVLADLPSAEARRRSRREEAGAETCWPAAGPWSPYGTASQRDDTNNLVATFLALYARLAAWSLLPNGRRALFYNFWGGRHLRPRRFRRRLASDLSERVVAARARAPPPRTSPRGSRSPRPAGPWPSPSRGPSTERSCWSRDRRPCTDHGHDGRNHEPGAREDGPRR